LLWYLYFGNRLSYCCISALHSIYISINGCGHIHPQATLDASYILEEDSELIQ
jgi:hypothetical protein